MLNRSRIAVVSAALLAVACSPVSKEEKAELAKPVDCTTAEGDIRVLNSEKDSVGKQIAEGISAIAPAGLVLGAVRGTEGDKVKVASGEYDRMIDKKIAEIEKTCGIQPTSQSG